jgi:hypothetical protein
MSARRLDRLLFAAKRVAVRSAFTIGYAEVHLRVQGAATPVRRLGRVGCGRSGGAMGNVPAKQEPWSMMAKSVREEVSRRAKVRRNYQRSASQTSRRVSFEVASTASNTSRSPAFQNP